MSKDWSPRTEEEWRSVSWWKTNSMIAEEMGVYPSAVYYQRTARKLPPSPLEGRRTDLAKVFADLVMRDDPFELGVGDIQDIYNLPYGTAYHVHKWLHQPTEVREYHTDAPFSPMKLTPGMPISEFIAEANMRKLTNRVAIMQSLEDADGPIRVLDLAELVGLSRNTTFNHLLALESRGRVSIYREEVGGRPHIVKWKG